jgi:hypothetical protein
MLRLSLLLRKARIQAFSPWKRRPSGLVRNSNPEFVHPGAFRRQHGRLNPEDTTRLIKPSHMLVKHCSSCNRTKLIPLQERDYFHTCCEGRVMKIKTTMQGIMDKARNMETLHRQWDIENDRAWSNATRPRPKGRSKFKK